MSASIVVNLVRLTLLCAALQFVEPRFLQSDNVTCNIGPLKHIKEVTVTEACNSTATGALIFLHGSGDNGTNFRHRVDSSLGAELALPHIRIIYPTAPLISFSAFHGLPTRTWYDVSNFSMEATENNDDLDRVTEDFRQIIKSQEDCGIPPERIAIAGFSRGGAMSFHVGYQLAPNIAGVGVMSSWIPYSSLLYQSLGLHTGGLPRLLQMHGTADELVDISLGRRTFLKMKQLGVAGDFVALPGQSHEVTRDSLTLLLRFVLEVIPEDHLQ